MAYDSEITPKSADLIVLEKARERIARGWVQGTRRCERGVCILGALHGVPWEDELRFLALLGLPDPDYDIDELRPAAAWNDAPGRTQAEVLARFDEAISRLASAQ